LSNLYFNNEWIRLIHGKKISVCTDTQSFATEQIPLFY
jgi:hypothetical protein